jgi:hypothetical protein
MTHWWDVQSKCRSISFLGTRIPLKMMWISIGNLFLFNWVHSWFLFQRLCLHAVRHLSTSRCKYLGCVCVTRKIVKK